MGKLKEKYLNNLSEEEIWEKTVGELSAFEYVEYVGPKKQYHQLSLFDGDGYAITDEQVLEQMAIERKMLEDEFYEEEYLYEINDSILPKYSDNDINEALDLENISERNKQSILKKLNEIWNDKRGFNEKVS